MGCRLFISYARSDDHPDYDDPEKCFVKKLYDDLISHDHVVWWDRMSMPGRGFSFLKEIENAIIAVDRLILIVGPGALESDYVRAEWKYALKICKVVNPILRLGSYDSLPLELKGLHCPDFRSTERYSMAFSELLRLLSEVIPPIGDHFACPPLPTQFIKREKIVSELSNQLIGSDTSKPTAIVSTKQTASLSGLGGIGKSVMAAAFIHDCYTRRNFKDGLIWLNIGKNPDLLEKLRAIGEIFYDDLLRYNDIESCKYRLVRLLSDKNCLVVLDDVWDKSTVRPFMDILGKQCRLLITTRDRAIPLSLDMSQTRIDTLSQDEAVKLLIEFAGREEETFTEIVNRLGNLPLALKLAGKRLGEGMSGHAWLERFNNSSYIKLSGRSDDPADNLELSFDLSVNEFNDADRLLYYSLGIFPEDTWVPKKIIIRLWQYTLPHIIAWECEQLIDDLEMVALIDVNRGIEVTLHDLLHDYTRSKLGDNRASELHNNLLDSYNPVNSRTPWYDIEDDGYIVRFLDYHFLGAGRKTELYQLLWNAPTWLESVVLRTGSRNLALERLVVKIFELFWVENTELAHKFVTKWLSRNDWIRWPRRTYTSKFVGIRCAFEVSDIDALFVVLNEASSSVRSVAVAYIYFSYRQQPDIVFNKIFIPFSKEAVKLGIPNLGKLRTLIELIILALIHEYSENDKEFHNISRLIELAKEVSRNALFMNNKVLKRTTKAIRKPFLDTIIRLVIAVLDSQRPLALKQTDNVINLQELEIFFDDVQRSDAPVREAIRFFDRGYGDLVKNADKIVAVYDRENYGNRWDFTGVIITSYIITIHGVHNPDSVIPAIQEILALNHPDWAKPFQIHFVGVWRTIVLQQKIIEQRWLDYAHQLTSEYYDNIKDGYGVVKSCIRDYNYFPLRDYSEIWNRVHPDKPVDLVQKYILRAERYGDTAFILHIINSFARPGTSFFRNRPIMEQFAPYLQHSNDAVSSATIDLFARLRTKQENQVDNFLFGLRLPDQQIIERIKEMGVTEAYYDVAFEFRDMAVNLVYNAPSEGISWFVKSLSNALNKYSARAALLSFFEDYITLLEEE